MARTSNAFAEFNRVAASVAACRALQREVGADDPEMRNKLGCLAGRLRQRLDEAANQIINDGARPFRGYVSRV